MNVTRSLARRRPGALRAGLLGVLAWSCTGLPAMLQPVPENALELPLPEQGPRPRTRAAHELEAFSLPNGLTVVLLEDHARPKVVVDLAFGVGSRDEAPGRRGFAHLLEHLWPLGSSASLERQLEQGGGACHASTGRDRCHRLGLGPAALLPTLLQLTAERLAALGEPLAQSEFERQRARVLHERRRNDARVPYGAIERLLPAALYPPTHPYHHPVIGSPAELETAALAELCAFAREFYGPASATLVVAGDFDPDEVRPLIERTFGTLAARPAPVRPTAAPVVLTRETRVTEHERVEFPKLVLAWHSPPEFARGDAELDLLATILAEGSESRLERRLVLDTRLAQEVDASQRSGELGSVFVIEALAAPGADLERVAREILAAVDELAREGPSAAELARAQARQRARFLRRIENLQARAGAIQSYCRAFGVADGFQRDLERWTKATRADLCAVARAVLGPGRVDLRILPQAAHPERTAASPGESAED